MSFMGEGFRWVGLRVVDTSQRCPCASGTGSTPDQSCKRCLGLGHPFTDLLTKAYVWKDNPGVEFYTEAGRISTSRRNVVLRYDRPVKKFDQILLLSLDPDTGEPIQPFDVLSILVVQDVFAMRGTAGRVEFWKATAEERSFTDDRPGGQGSQYTYHTSAPDTF